MAHCCPICRSTASVQPLLEKNGWQLHRCRTCDHIFVSPQPTEEDLRRVYSFDAGYQTQSIVRYDEAQRFSAKLAERLDQISRHVPSGTLLDVGCSSGRLLFLARQRGYRVQGVELNRDTAEIALANDLPVVVGALEEAAFPPASFDVVHLGDIIEHVPDPGEMLAQVRKLVKPGGIVLIATPNHDAFFPRATYGLHRMTGIPWSHPTPPHHLHQFSVTSLRALLERSGLAVVETRFAPCSLAYELRGTGVFRPLKEALAQRRPVEVLRRAAVCAAATVAYTTIWAADRAAVGKRRDFDMRVVASPSGA